jgi:20S proteasome alpha/beta subunit
MTYILGARCLDGVVLVGDTKISIEGGADFAYSKKIAEPLTTVVMGSAGIGGLYKDFQNRIISTILQHERDQEEGEKPLITTEEEFSVLVSRVIRGMHSDYDEDRHLIINNLMIICATRIGISGEAQLTTFNPYGFPEPVNKIRAIGHGEPYGALFLKKMWNQSMTMEQTAKIGLFIIKFIQEMKLDNSVGYDDEFLPQVFYIPDIQIPEDFHKRQWQSQEESDNAYLELYKSYPIKELEKEEIQYFINQISSKIADFEDIFKRGEFKL